MKCTELPGIFMIYFCLISVTELSGKDFQYATPLRHSRSYERHRSSEDGLSENSVKPAVARSAMFITQNSSTVLAQVGGTARLPCVVKKYGNAVVSWIRKQDSPTLLTVGPTTHSSDKRIVVEYVRQLQNWGLLIKHVHISDAGFYECQVSTHPPTSIFVLLRIIEASAEIVGLPDLNVRAGSVVKIVCVLRHSTEPPLYYFWYRNDRMINYDGDVVVQNNTTSSVLMLKGVKEVHSGNYTCAPSNAIPAHVNVHVLDSFEGEHPAAMLDVNIGITLNRQRLLLLILYKLFVLLFL